MFENKKEFPWRIPIMILLGVLVLAGGIYVGLSTTKDVANKENSETTNSKEKSKEVFELSEDCLIWVETLQEDGTISDDGLTMIGNIPNELMGKSKNEITAYLTKKYPNRTVKSIDEYEITLVEQATSNDISRANKFSIQDDKGHVYVYKYDENGNRSIHKKTDIETEMIPEPDRSKIKAGIVVNSEDEVYSNLESFGS
ncbi:MAG: hypothetical protein J6D47_03360 [Peptostreptococcaceae bacterium]|nr:hypothetical protein [Peptostreptococcaceae bacterium]